MSPSSTHGAIWFFGATAIEQPDGLITIQGLQSYKKTPSTGVMKAPTARPIKGSLQYSIMAQLEGPTEA